MHLDDTGRPNRLSTSDILWRGVDRSIDCWERGGYRDQDGYTRIDHGTYRIFAHRAAWQEASGEVLSRDDVICHTCDTPACIRNDEQGTYAVESVTFPRWGHLFKATTQANLRDRTLKGRTAKGDRNGSRTHPEKIPRGDNHTSRLYPERRPRGEANTAAKLTEQDVLEIRRLYAAGVKVGELAQRFNVHRLTIRVIYQRKSWAHI